MRRIDAMRFRRTIERAAALQSDEDALDNISLYPKWREDIDVSVGDRYRDDGTLYKCIQGHHTQSDWKPHLTPALWTVVSLDEWPAWRQPLNAEEAYHIDDKVSHNGKHWISAVDNNVWEPGGIGTESLWSEII